MKKISGISKLLLSLSVLSVICFASIYPSCSTASLSDVKVCSSLSGNDCGSDASSISVEAQSIYCTANLNNAPDKTKVTFDWKHAGVSVAKADVETGSGIVKSTLNTNGALEPGKYSVTVKIEVDNSAPITKEFTVE